jgi:AcrR family transcriptional regulator
MEKSTNPDDEQGRRKRSDAVENREKIMRAAIKVLGQVGVDAYMTDIAEAADVGVATVYRNFPNKEDLVNALALDRVTRMAEGANAAAEAPDAWEALVGMIRWIVDRQLEDRALSQFFGGRVAGSAELQEQRNSVYVTLERVVARAMEQGKLRTDVNVSDVRMAMVAISRLSTGDSPIARRLVHRLLGIMIDGLRAPGFSKLPGPPVPVARSEEAIHPETDDDENTAYRRGRKAWKKRDFRSAEEEITSKD